MAFRIAIQPDLVVHRNGERQCYSERWVALAAEQGIAVRMVDVFRQDWLAQLEGCDGFLWRSPPSFQPRQFVMRLTQALHLFSDILLFPAWRDIWHFEDKVTQAYGLAAAGIPVPDTAVQWNREAALAYCRQATYPRVLKLAGGYQSLNVKLLKSFDEAEYYIDRMFGSGLRTVPPRPPTRLEKAKRRLHDARIVLNGGYPNSPSADWGLEYGHFLTQEYLPGNDFDTRITVIGDRAFAFRRFNRSNDFRASGSGKIDLNPAAIDPQAIRLGFQAAGRFKSHVLALDCLRRNDELVVVELALAFAAWIVRDCPGHWTLGPNDQLVWHEGSMRPEDAIFSDFVNRLSLRAAEAGQT